MTIDGARNPYSFRYPLAGGQSFIGRHDLFRKIFDDLLFEGFAGMVSLFGARNIGTTSMLLALANKEIQNRYAGKAFDNWRFAFIDLKELPTLSAEAITSIFLKMLGQAACKEFPQTSNWFSDLKHAGDEIAKQGLHVVILLDELDRLVEMKNEYAFLDRLFYALMNREGNNVNMVTASKRPLYELFLACQTRFGDDLGSPFFVHFRPLRVGLFSYDEARDLVVGVSEKTRISLRSDYRRILRLGGRFPHFLQIACFIAFEQKMFLHGLSRAGWAKVVDSFEAIALPYYLYFWENFTPFERQAVVDIARQCPFPALPGDVEAIAVELQSRREIADDYVFRLEASWGLNAISLRKAECGSVRSEELSEWIWTILRKEGKKVRLFSESFTAFIATKAKTAPSVPTYRLVPRLLALLHANLRRHFDAGPPEKESDVQRAVQLILDGVGADFTREGEQFAFSLKGWRPDHASGSGIAIEVKLCKQERDVKRIIEEISADLIPYRSRFKVVVVVVYDLGQIADELGFRRDFEKQEGVFVLIRKH